MAGVETVAAGFAFVFDFAAEEGGEEGGGFIGFVAGGMGATIVSVVVG